MERMNTSRGLHLLFAQGYALFAFWSLDTRGNQVGDDEVTKLSSDQR